MTTDACTQAADRNRFTQMAKDYDRMAPLLVPMYDFLQVEMIRQAGVVALDAPRVIDLGAGSGRLLERVLTANDRASCRWVDSSEAFLAVAKRRLERFGERVTFIVSPMEGDWRRNIDGPVDVVFSMSAIHHLESGEKRAVYAAAFDVLRPGGWFINTDEMRTLSTEAYRETLLFWARSVDERAGLVPPELRTHARRWQHHFENWKRRNIDAFDQPKTKGDDMHESFVAQTEWLRDIGFAKVDVFVKYHLWCMVGGQKPAELRIVDFSHFGTRSYVDSRGSRLKCNSGVPTRVALFRDRPCFTGLSRPPKWLNHTELRVEN